MKSPSESAVSVAEVPRRDRTVGTFVSDTDTKKTHSIGKKMKEICRPQRCVELLVIDVD